MCCPRCGGLVENEEQDENKKMKSIVVEEQEQEEGSESESETGFVDLDPDTLRNVLKRVDVFTLGRAACVNKLWRGVAWDNRLWEPIYVRYLTSCGVLQSNGRYLTVNGKADFSRFRRGIIFVIEPPPPPDFYSIDFSKKIRPWV